MNNVKSTHVRKVNIHDSSNASTLVFSNYIDKIKESIYNLSIALYNFLGKEGAICQCDIDEKLNKHTKCIHDNYFKDKVC